MKRVIFILFFWLRIAYANNIVGVNTLILPQDNDYIVNYNSGQYLDEIKKTNKDITNSTVVALNKFNTEILKTKILESSVVLFDGEKKIQEIIKNNPQFIDDVVTQDILPINESIAAVIKKQNHQFYLIGHVTKISCGELRHKVMLSNDISWLYNLDIVIKFRLIDASTLKPIAEFNALGHGGMAKILSSSSQVIDVKPDKIVNDAMNALYNNVWHDLIVLKQKVD